MAFVRHRIFYGKVGKGDQLIEVLKQVNLMVRGQGAPIKPRILSDYNSGRTDRVIMEWEAISIEALDSVESDVMAYEEGPELFSETFNELTELIEFAEVHTWQTH